MKILAPSSKKCFELASIFATCGKRYRFWLSVIFSRFRRKLTWRKCFFLSKTSDSFVMQVTKQLEGGRVRRTALRLNFPSTSDHSFSLKKWKGTSLNEKKTKPCANFLEERYFTEKYSYEYFPHTKNARN